VADGVLADPDRPARLADDVADPDRLLDLATTGVQIEDALVDAERVGHLDGPLDQGREIAGDLAVVAQPHQSSLGTGRQRGAHC
jgi:hypothetical protein